MTLKQNKNKRSNSRSCFLVASPYAGQTPYGQSVVLLVRSDQSGAAGILLDSEFRQSFKRLSNQDPTKSVAAGRRLANELELSILNWTPEELLEELELGVWLTTPAKREDLSRNEDLWAELVRRVGRSVLGDSLSIRHFPLDPTVN